jgi:hypothetical protein
MMVAGQVSGLFVAVMTSKKAAHDTRDAARPIRECKGVFEAGYCF